MEFNTGALVHDTGSELENVLPWNLYTATTSALVSNLLKYRISANIPFHVLKVGPEILPAYVNVPITLTVYVLAVTVFENALDFASCPFFHIDAPVFDIVKHV